MRKLLLLLIFVPFLYAEANAQEVLHLGIKGGVNFTNLSSEYFAGHNMKTGYHLGLLAEVDLGSRFSVQPELLYSTRGADAELLTLGGSPITDEISLDYIQVPVLANFELFPRFSLQAGPSFNFLVDEKSRNYRKQNVNDFEFGGAVGASYKLYSGLFADFRYDQGFTNVLDGAHSRNSGFQLGLGYMF